MAKFDALFEAVTEYQKEQKALDALRERFRVHREVMEQLKAEIAALEAAVAPLDERIESMLRNAKN